MGLELKEKKNNGKRVIDFCAERGLSVSNTYFEHKSLQKYTSMSRGQDEHNRSIAGEGSFAAL